MPVIPVNPNHPAASADPPVPGGYQTYSLEGDNDFLEESCGGGSDGGGGGGGSNGGGLMKPMVRLEIGVTRMQVSVPRIHIGDNSAQIKAMRLANVQTFGSNLWRPNRVLAVPQIDSICGADRKRG